MFLVQLLSWTLLRTRDGVLLGTRREGGLGASRGIAMAWTAHSVSRPEQLRKLWDTQLAGAEQGRDELTKH